MEKRHYELIAKIIHDSKFWQDIVTRRILLVLMGDFATNFEYNNARFNEDLFIEACTPEKYR